MTKQRLHPTGWSQAWYQLKIGTRLTLGFMLILALLVAMAGMGWFSSRQLSEGLRTVYEDRAVPVQQLSQVNYLLQRNGMLVLDVQVRPDQGNMDARHQEMSANLQALEQTWAAYEARQHPPQVQALVQAFSEQLSAYQKDGLVPANQAMAQYDFDEVAFRYLTYMVKLAPQVQEPLDQLLKLEVELAQQEYLKAERTQRTLDAVLLAGVLLALGLGVLLAWFITRSIVGPIRLAVQVAHTVAEGNLTSRIEPSGRDETGQLLQALDAMNAGLIRIVSEVRQGSGMIALGATEIAGGSADLSQRTEAQAANLEQTAASVEEITTTVRRNADTAREASALAQQAREAALHGGEVVGRVVTTMDAISTSSRKVADITSVIDGIAFQTNILALNAAVEAARAGEAGRGFAVVAGEVRTLAQRSAEAAREIKALLDESAQRVEQGTALVGEAGRSVHGIVEQVQRVASLIGDITHASTAQASGVAQVGAAVANLDAMTQHNAAMVEESTASAEQLRHQAERLEQVVQVFRLPGHAGASRHADELLSLT